MESVVYLHESEQTESETFFSIDASLMWENWCSVRFGRRVLGSFGIMQIGSCFTNEIREIIEEASDLHFYRGYPPDVNMECKHLRFDERVRS